LTHEEARRVDAAKTKKGAGFAFGPLPYHEKKKCGPISSFGLRLNHEDGRRAGFAFGPCAIIMRRKIAGLSRVSACV